MNTLIRDLVRINTELYASAKNPLRSHGVDHHERVYKNALKLAKAIRVRYNAEILAGACLLHDLAAYYPAKTGEKYHNFDYILARKALLKISFPKEKVSAVLDAIAHHGSDSKYKNKEESIETTLLRDSDKMDVFGALGVARIVMVRTLKGDSLKDIVRDFYTEGHLKRKWDSITTKEARELCRSDYLFALNFFRDLAKKLK